MHVLAKLGKRKLSDSVSMPNTDLQEKAGAGSGGNNKVITFKSVNTA
jgi:hypothetical protein